MKELLYERVVALVVKVPSSTGIQDDGRTLLFPPKFIMDANYSFNPPSLDLINPLCLLQTLHDS
jgi:hypothetical protein